MTNCGCKEAQAAACCDGSSKHYGEMTALEGRGNVVTCPPYALDGNNFCDCKSDCTEHENSYCGCERAQASDCCNTLSKDPSKGEKVNGLVVCPGFSFMEDTFCDCASDCTAKADSYCGCERAKHVDCCGPNSGGSSISFSNGDTHHHNYHAGTGAAPVDHTFTHNINLMNAPPGPHDHSLSAPLAAPSSPTGPVTHNINIAPVLGAIPAVPAPSGGGDSSGHNVSIEISTEGEKNGSEAALLVIAALVGLGVVGVFSFAAYRVCGTKARNGAENLV